ncbi:hypothetical protein [Streptococcus suis]|uniref:hypothetical protein n=1 Tax=Streptococcus suis TaxID=1307 RepID=UPI000CF47C5A|nr:hypothetical protein [Streptococcus suis]
MHYRFIKGSSPRLLVFFHGTGGNKESILFLRQQLDPKASVLSMEVGVKAGTGVSLHLSLTVSWILSILKSACRLFWIFGRT